MAKISNFKCDKKYLYIKVICEDRIEYKKYLKKIKAIIKSKEAKP